MRKLILIAAFVLASATAQAGATRGLVLASGDEPTAAEAPKPVEAAQPVEAPKSVSRPAAVNLSDHPQAEQARPGAERNTHPQRAERPRRKRGLTEARVIYELHRYGIYW
jgi:D-aminopeptidase